MSYSVPEYDDLDATALADLISRGELSAREVLEAAIERAEARGKCHTDLERAGM